MAQGTLLPVLIVALLAGGFAHGAETATSTVQSNRDLPAIIERSDERQAGAWGLSAEEWGRFETLMRGPTGVYSPNLDPLTALGIEARSDEERRRYAELQVQAESRRIEKLLAYQRAYDAAWKRLYPDTPRLNMPTAEPTTGSSLPTPTTDRTAVFVTETCAACDRTVRRLQASGTAIDIYMVGSRDDDALIRAWAKRAGIDAAKVRDGNITLNHDSGRWSSLGLPGDVPAVVRQVNGQWQRQP